MEDKWLIGELLLMHYHVAPLQSCPVRDIYQAGISLPGVLGSLTGGSQPHGKILIAHHPLPEGVSSHWFMQGVIRIICRYNRDILSVSKHRYVGIMFLLNIASFKHIRFNIDINCNRPAFWMNTEFRLYDTGFQMLIMCNE